ncbi:MAG: hypothetical protein HYS68_00670 [Candidatus Levybacteria bacterium]|nr:hypothetical protein [Candidatus Levybacteria bacterium]
MILKICNRIIEYAFYALFFLLPLVFTSDTYELFEFPKMWLVFAITLIIACFWLIKMVLQGRFFVAQTPLDIPIVLFLLSQIISTIFSLDIHVSMWGYYSRFNGGLLSILSYIFLYYAFISNIMSEGWRARGTPVEHPQGAKRARMSDGGEARQDPERIVKRLIFVSLISGAIVALWGLPSHFGYDLFPAGPRLSSQKLESSQL